MKPSIFSSVLWMLLGAFLYFTAVFPSANAAESMRWGIVTRKTVADLPKPEPQGDRVDGTIVPPAEGAPLPAGNAPPARPDTVAVEKVSPPQVVSPAVYHPEGQQVNAALEPKKKTALKGRPDADVKKVEKKIKSLEWTGPVQKETCEEYIHLLRGYFLKTRHYSIQGASCDTAQNAAAFLQINEKCERECPQGVMLQYGYSDRILRNIRYLEALGKDRCGTDPMPAMPLVQQAVPLPLPPSPGPPPAPVVLPN